MTPDEAREILRRCRPGSSDLGEPEVLPALELAARDPVLREWWAQEQKRQGGIRSALRSIEPPESLRTRLDSMPAPAPATLPRRAAIRFALAAVVALLVAGALRWWRSPGAETGFEIWRQRMARTALREYRMDVVTNSLPAVRQFLAQSNRHDPLPVPSGIQNLPVLGGAALRFRNEPVSMLCFDRGAGRLLWLFVVNRAAIPDAPADRRFVAVGDLAIATWAEGDQVVLAAVEDAEPVLRGFLPP